MTEAELEIFDLLKKDKLTKDEEKQVKLAALDLLEILFNARNQILVLEWHKENSTQEKVKYEIKRILDKHLPISYDPEIFNSKADVVFRHLYELAEMWRGMAA